MASQGYGGIDLCVKKMRQFGKILANLGQTGSDGGSALAQCWVNALCLMSYDHRTGELRHANACTLKTN